MAKRTGMGGSITVGGTAYPVTNWAVTTTNDVQDVTDTGSGGWAARLPAVASSEATFTAFYGSAVTSLNVTFAQGASVACSFALGNSGAAITGTFIVASHTITNDAKTPIEFQCTAQSDGAVTFPT